MMGFKEIAELHYKTPLSSQYLDILHDTDDKGKDTKELLWVCNTGKFYNSLILILSAIFENCNSKVCEGCNNLVNSESDNFLR